MSPILIIVLVWVGLAMLVLVAGLSITTRTGPLPIRKIELEEARSDEAPDHAMLPSNQKTDFMRERRS